MNTTPLVSIILPSYNYAPFLSAAIDSIHSQSYPNWELIIIDDASTDQSPSIARHYQNLQPEKVKTIFLEKNQGLRKVISLGLEESKGDFIAFLEADDKWLPQSLEKKMKEIIAMDAVLVFSDVMTIGDNNCWKGEIDDQLKSTVQMLGKLPKSFVDSSIFYKNYVPTFSCVLAKKSSFSGINFSAPSDYRLDHWLWAQISLKGPFTFIKEKLTVWRIHQNSYSFKQNNKNEKFFHERQEEFLKELFHLLSINSQKTSDEFDQWLKENCIIARSPITRPLTFIETKRLSKNYIWKMIIQLKDLTWMIFTRAKRKVSLIRSKALGKTF